MPNMPPSAGPRGSVRVGARHSSRATRALQRLAETDPALAALALWCRHEDGPPEGDAPAPPAWSDARRVVYGPGFEALSLPEQVGLCAHHVLHIAFCHATRADAMAARLGGAFQRDVFNIAADALLNEALHGAGYALPRPALRLGPLLAALQGRDAPDGQAALGLYDAEALYTALLHPPTRGSAGASGAPGPRGRAGEAAPGQGGRGGGGAGAGAKAEGGGGARAEALRAEAARQGFAPDLRPAAPGAGGEAPHPPAAEMPDLAEWRQHVARALAEGRRAGRGIGMLGHLLADLPAARTPWEALLRGLVGRALAERPRPAPLRPARHWLAADAVARRSGRPGPGFQPGFQRAALRPRLAVCLDCSSSVDGALLARFGAEVAGIARRSGAEMHLLTFDTELRAHRVLEGWAQEAEIARLPLARGGGTDFRPVLAEAAARHPSAIVVLTDLEGPAGAPPGAVPVIWAVPGAPVPPKAPFGRVISLAR